MRFQSILSSLGRLSILGIVLMAPWSAWAETPYSVSIRAQAYQPLPVAGGTAQTHPASGNGDQWVQPFQLPFSIKFFDEEKDTAYISSNGWVSFIQTTNSNHNNKAIPTTDAPNDIIAPFWDDLGCHSFKTQIVGTAPSRTAIIEWPCFRWNNENNSVEMQVWLFEGSSTIEIHYGQIADSANVWNATMGIENADGSNGYWIPSASTGNDCGNTCAPADFHTNSVVTFSQGPELRVGEVRGALEGFAGIPMDISATIVNVGGEPAEDFTVRFWVSPEPRIMDRSIELLTLDGDVRSLPPQGQTIYEASPRLPTSLDSGSFYILAEADPYERVPESSRGDNVGVFGPFEVGIRAANLAAYDVDLDDEIVPLGGSVGVEWTLENTGNLPARDIPYAVVLSPSRTVGISAVELTRGSVDSVESLGALRLRHDVVPIPADLLPGQYYMAVVMDPDHVIFEHDRSDNTGVSMPFFIHGDGLDVLTEVLPPASLEGHYSVRLRAMGGDGIYHWEVADGSTLPPGLSLVEEPLSDGRVVTFLRGVPAAAGEFTFTLLVRSGDQEVAQTMSLQITLPGGDLQVLNDILASAAFGARYEEHLAAHGGVPPYTWSISRGELPVGVLLRSDGFLSGVPRQDGTFSPTVQVVDSAGAIATRTLDLEVSPPASLTCVTRELPPFELGKTVFEHLLAAGGRKIDGTSYTWHTVSTTRLAEGLGQVAETIDGPPPGLRLDSGVVRGSPTEFGTYAWTLQVRDQSDSADCRVLVRVPMDHGLSVSTKSLPVALAGRSFRAELVAAGGDGAYEWEELAPGRVLEDLGLSFQGGALIGTPPMSALDGEPSKEFSFMVRVRDEANRIGIGALTLRIEASPTQPKAAAKDGDDGGCQAGTGGAGLAGLALVGLALLRRRR